MSEFWKNKLRTYLYVFDYDKDGYLSEKDYTDIAFHFADAYNATPEKKDNLIRIFQNVWRKFMKAGDMEKENRVTVAVFIASIKQQLYDPELTIAFTRLIHGLFELIDVSLDGYLQPREHSDWFKNCGVPEGTFDKKFAFDAVDTNHDGKISIEEFTAAFFDFLYSEDESSPKKFFFGPLIDETKYP